jgi:hypothetical protein
LYFPIVPHGEIHVHNSNHSFSAILSIYSFCHGGVTLQTLGKNKYWRTMAYVLRPDSTTVNHELVKDG